MIYNGITLKGLESERVQVLTRYLALYLTIPALEVCTLIYLVSIGETSLILITLIISSGLVLPGVLIAEDLKKKYFQKIKSILFTAMLKEVLPHAEFIGDRTGKISESALSKLPIRTLQTDSYIEKSLVQVSDFSLRDAEVIRGSGKQRKIIFDGFICELDFVNPSEGFATFSNISPRSIEVGKWLKGLVSAWFIIIAVILNLGLDQEDKKIYLSVFSFFILMSTLIPLALSFKYKQVIDQKNSPSQVRKHWNFSAGFKAENDILETLESVISQNEYDFLGRDRMMYVDPKKLILAFGNYSDFLEVSLFKRLSPDIQTKNLNRLHLIVDLIQRIQKISSRSK